MVLSNRLRSILIIMTTKDYIVHIRGRRFFQFMILMCVYLTISIRQDHGSVIRMLKTHAVRCDKWSTRLENKVTQPDAVRNIVDLKFDCNSSSTTPPPPHVQFTHNILILVWLNLIRRYNPMKSHGIFKRRGKWIPLSPVQCWDACKWVQCVSKVSQHWMMGGGEG